MKRKIGMFAAILLAVAMTAALGCAAPATPAEEPTAAPETTAAIIEASAEPTEEPTPTPKPEPTPTPVPENRSQTSGKIIPEGTPSKPVIVSIENSDPAKPQTGLMEADIIYEFQVESMITRFQVLYNDKYPIYAGPMRSLRYYFVDLAQEWDCMYLHIGGVTLDKPYKRIPSKVISIYPRSGVEDFYGFSAAFNPATGAYNDYSLRGYRFRTADRSEPSNLYVMVDKTFQKYYGKHEAAVYERFKFLENVSYENGESFSTVSLPYMNTGDPAWIQFVYHADNNRLYRKESGKDFEVYTPSEDGATLTVDQMNVQNLIVQHVKYGNVEGDDKGRRTCELVGTGKCDYFINGQHVTGTWSRPTLEDYTTYMLNDGSTVILEPGNTWVAVHPDNMAITVA